MLTGTAQRRYEYTCGGTANSTADNARSNRRKGPLELNTSARTLGERVCREKDEREARVNIVMILLVQGQC